MESLLFLGNVSSLPILVRNNSALGPLLKTKQLRFSFCNHSSSLRIGDTCQCHPLRTAFRPAIQAMEGSSTSAAYPLGGRYALKSLLDVNVCLASSKLEPPGPPSRLPLKPSRENINDIKMHAVRLMKYGKPEEAVLYLQNAYKFYEHDNTDPAYNVGMALVEILIFQGEYTEALQYCNRFNDENILPSDGRIPLCRAIIHTMLEQKIEAKKWWDEYVETVDAGQLDGPIDITTS